MQGQGAAIDQDATLGIQVQQRFVDFLRNFRLSAEDMSATDAPTETENREPEYIRQLEIMNENEQTTIFVDFAHLMRYDQTLASALADQYYRFEPFVRSGVYSVVAGLYPEFAQSHGTRRDFYVSFFNLSSSLKIRDLRMDLVGQLVAFNGTVTRTSEVRPELLYAHFLCLECGGPVANVEQQFKYTEPTRCPNTMCNNNSKWHLELGRSTFVDWQRVRVQENADEIPPGSMPRSVDVILRHGSVERAKAGDKCTFTGSFVVVPDVAQLYKAGEVPSRVRAQAARAAGAASGDGVTGLKVLGVRDLTYRTAFIATSVVTQEGRDVHVPDAVDFGRDTGLSSEEAAAMSFDEADRQEISSMAHRSDLYQLLVRSIAPTVFGHDEIKRGILLMLFGGVQKQSREGMRLRGDVNVCIVGDPSTAKSQFLKYVCNFMPRAVYTSGKASTAAGLTASVAKDPDTGEFTIEAGALMLADNGVCCIDEFDKMDDADQVAIHEAMEQQTISITKAGIQATLNARTSILAAANPIFGRYDRTKTLRKNVTLSAPIMSRFDLFFVVLDECNDITDRNIAEHIVRVHQRKAQALNPPFSMSQMQKYIRFARAFNPRLTPAVMDSIVSCYRRLRQADVAGASRTSYRITVRQLESMIRLSEALARLHLDDEVKPEYVMEAYRLLRKSIIHVETADIDLGDDDEDVPLGGGGGGGDGGGDGGDGGAPADGDSQPAAGSVTTGGETAAAKAQISYDKYVRMAKMMCLHIRSKEDANEATGGAMRQGDVIAWYLEEISSVLQSQEEMAVERTLANQVIHRLVTKDGVLTYVDLDGEDARGGGDETDTAVAKDPEERMIAVHPDFVIT